MIVKIKNNKRSRRKTRHDTKNSAFSFSISKHNYDVSCNFVTLMVGYVGLQHNFRASKMFTRKSLYNNENSGFNS